MTPSAIPILAMLPLLVFGGAAVLRPAPAIVPKPVQIEGVTARRMDDAAFTRRWPVELMSRRSDPLLGCGDACPTRRLKDTLEAGSVSNAATGKPEARKARHVIHEVPAVAVAAATPTPRPARIVRRASLRLDVCARHGLRKVETNHGRWKSWRCRR